MSALAYRRKTSAFPLFPLARAIAVVAIFLGGWFLIASLRTTQFGESAQSLKSYLLFTPLIFIAALGVFLGTKHPVRYAAFLTFVILLAAVMWANLEETLVVNVLSQTCRPTEQAACHPLPEIASENQLLVYSRAWPFHHHTISYHPIYGWQGND